MDGVDDDDDDDGGNRLLSVCVGMCFMRIISPHQIYEVGLWVELYTPKRYAEVLIPKNLPT